MNRNSKMMKGTARVLGVLSCLMSVSSPVGAKGNTGFHTSFNTNLTNNTSFNNSTSFNTNFTQNNSFNNTNYSTTNNYNNMTNINVDAESDASKQKRTKMKSDSYLRAESTKANAEVTKAGVLLGAGVGYTLYNSWNDNDPTWKKVLKGTGIALCVVLSAGIVGLSFWLSWKNASAK